MTASGPPYLSLCEAALDELGAVKDVFRVALQGVRLCASPDLQSVVAAQLMQGAGFQPGIQQPADDTAEELLEIAQELQRQDFVPLLRSALLQSYSTYEFFLKALCVDFALRDPSRALGLSVALRVKVSASVFLQEDVTERLFLLADEAWQQASAGQGLTGRSVNFLAIYCDPELARHVKADFDLHRSTLEQLHKLRVNLAHHGGRTGSLPVPVGPESMSKKTIDLYLKSLIQCCEAVFTASPFPLHKNL